MNASYCRKSTSQTGVDDDQKSVVRQEENARAFGGHEKAGRPDSHVYADDAVSGAETLKLVNRQRLLVISAAAGRRFRSSSCAMPLASLDAMATRRSAN